jgi:hypothetical protein
MEIFSPHLLSECLYNGQYLFVKHSTDIDLDEEFAIVLSPFSDLFLAESFANRVQGLIYDYRDSIHKEDINELANGVDLLTVYLDI